MKEVVWWTQPAGKALQKRSIAAMDLEGSAAKYEERNLAKEASLAVSSTRWNKRNWFKTVFYITINLSVCLSACCTTSVRIVDP